MQATAILLFAFCVQVSAATYSQTVSFTGKDVPLKTVFAAVKKQTGYGVFYANGEAVTLEGSGNVTLDLKNVALDLFLQVCLRNQPLEYSLEGTTIFIKKKEMNAIAIVDHSDSALVSEIKGRVTNDKGEPLVNANVIIKRTGKGTITDANGNFTLRNVNTEDILLVSYIGYKMQTIPVKERVAFTLVMQHATDDLDKMVVQAYGQTSQRLATGNIGVVRAEDIAKQPVVNVLQAVQGQVPGVVVTNTSGFATGTVKMEIRGRNTINSNFPSDPLYIIDGVPLTILDIRNSDNYETGSQGVIQSGIPSPANGQSPFFSINPADIESIEILKDADATAIYGSRGSNGVVLITTKKGKSGKTRLDINVYSGISQVPKYYKMLNTKQYVQMRKEALANDGLSMDIYNAPDLTVWDTTRYTDWQHFFWGRLGKSTESEASLSGGDNRTTFRIAAGYHYLTEILASSGATQRGSLSANINHKSLNQKFSVSLSGNYSVSSINMILIPGSINLAPNAPPVYDNKGNLNFAGWTPLDYIYPFGTLLRPYNSSTNLLNSNLTTSYEIMKGLNVKLNLGYNNIQTNQKFSTPIISQDPIYNPYGSSSFGITLIHNVIVEPQLEYNGFINRGKINILLGTSYQNNKTNSTFYSGDGYTNDALISSVTNAPIKNVGNYEGQYKYAAVFARINYNWDGKYIINLNARRDGSSRFGQGKQFGNFGSIGGGWIFSEEPWVKKIFSFLSFGKIRGSYGTTGGDQIGNYQYLSQWSFNRFTYNGILPLTPLSHSDSLLHWQVNRKTEAAVDLGLMKDRIALEVVWYRNRCNNQLVQFPTPLFTGFNGVTSNSPADVQNTGWEFSVTSKNIETTNFKWKTKFNIGINRNKLLSYPNISQSPYASTLVVGKSLNVKRLLHYTGIDQQTGTYAFEDKTKDGSITIDYSGKTADDRYIVDLSPKFDGGFTNDFSFKNWQISIFFYFKKQRGKNVFYTLNAPGDNTNQPVSVLNRWQKPGDISSTPKFTTNPYADNSFINFQQSDEVYTNASFIRLQNLSISYQIPNKSLKKIGVQDCKIFTQGQNLFIITNYNGLDPEIQDFTTLPLARIITVGVSCNF